MDENIHKGLDILKDKKLNTVQRRDQFATLLLGLVDVRRIALFTLGQYRRTASPEDVEAFVGAFKNYATAAYQSYFAKYAKQNLKVIDSIQRNPTDFIVQTQLIDPGSSKQPAEVDFRVRTDAGKPGQTWRGHREDHAQRVIAEHAMLGDGEGIGFLMQRTAGDAEIAARIQLGHAFAEGGGGDPALADIDMCWNTAQCSDWPNPAACPSAARPWR